MSRLSTKQRRAARRRHSSFRGVHRTTTADWWRSKPGPPADAATIQRLLQRAWDILSRAEA